MHPVITRATELEQAGDPDGALALILSARAAEPADLELAVWHALLLYRRGEDAAAIPLLERCALSVPADRRARLLGALGVCYDRVGRADDAIEACRAALAIEPELVGPALILGLRLGEAQRLDEALAVFRRALPHAKPPQRLAIEQAIADLERHLAR